MKNFASNSGQNNKKHPTLILTLDSHQNLATFAKKSILFRSLFAPLITGSLTISVLLTQALASSQFSSSISGSNGTNGNGASNRANASLGSNGLGGKNGYNGINGGHGHNAIGISGSETNLSGYQFIRGGVGGNGEAGGNGGNGKAGRYGDWSGQARPAQKGKDGEAGGTGGSGGDGGNGANAYGFSTSSNSKMGNFNQVITGGAGGTGGIGGLGGTAGDGGYGGRANINRGGDGGNGGAGGSGGTGGSGGSGGNAYGFHTTSATLSLIGQLTQTISAGKGGSQGGGYAGRNGGSGNQGGWGTWGTSIDGTGGTGGTGSNGGNGGAGGSAYGFSNSSSTLTGNTSTQKITQKIRAGDGSHGGAGLSGGDGGNVITSAYKAKNGKGGKGGRGGNGGRGGSGGDAYGIHESSITLQSINLAQTIIAGNAGKGGGGGSGGAGGHNGNNQWTTSGSDGSDGSNGVSGSAYGIYNISSRTITLDNSSITQSIAAGSGPNTGYVRGIYNTGTLNIKSTNPISQSRITISSLSGSDPRVIDNGGESLSFDQVSLTYGNPNQSPQAALESRANTQAYFYFGNGKTIFNTALNNGVLIASNTSHFNQTLEQNINNSTYAQGIRIEQGTLALQAGNYSFNIISNEGHAVGISGNGSINNNAGSNSVHFDIQGKQASGIKIDGNNGTLTLSAIHFKENKIRGTESASGLYITGATALSANDVDFESKSIKANKAYGAIYQDGSSAISGVSFSSESIQGSEESAGILSKGSSNNITGLSFNNPRAVTGAKAYGLISESGATTLNQSSLFGTSSIDGSKLSAAIYFRGQNSTVNISNPSFAATGAVTGSEAHILSLDSAITGTIQGKQNFDGDILNANVHGAIYVQGKSEAMEAQLSSGLSFSNLKGSSSSQNLQTIGITLESGSRANLQNITFTEGALNGETGVGIRVLGGDSQSFLKSYSFSTAAFNGSKKARGVSLESGAKARFEKLQFDAKIEGIDEAVGIYANSGGNVGLTLEQATSFEAINSTNGSAYGIKDNSANGNYTFKGNLEFKKIQAAKDAIGLDIKQHRADMLDFQDDSGVIFDSIKGDTAIGARLGGTSSNLSLANTKWIFNNIEGKTKEVGIDTQGNISLKNKSTLFIGLNGTATDSYVFALNSDNKDVSLDHSLLALDFGNTNSKISEEKNTANKTLSLDLKNGARIIFGSSKQSKNIDLGTIDNLKADGAIDFKSIHTDKTQDLTSSKNNIVDLSMSVSANHKTITAPNPLNTEARNYYKTLKIGNPTKSNSKGLQGNNLVFRLYANANSGDKIVVNKADTAQGKQQHYFQVNFSKEEMPSLATHGFKQNIILVEVKKDYENSVLFKGLNSTHNKDQIEIMEGFNSFIVDIQNKYSNAAKEYYQYYIPSGAKLVSQGIGGTYVQTGIEANLATYQIFIANFNSLNKRVRDLRSNEDSEGLWSRIYNGQQSMDFATGSKINYTSLQLGFDESLDLKDSKLYLGTAFTYSFAKSDFDHVRIYERAAPVLNTSTLNFLDLAIYASYKDGNNSGFYSNSIAKLSYIINHLTTTGSDSYDVNATGASFSQEFGYRKKLPLGFFIDPQVKLSYAYLGAQNFTQIYNDPVIQYTEQAKFAQEHIHTLQSRVGINWGFDFKDFFAKDSKANAQLYLGTYYSYDYIQGGGITIANLDKTLQKHLIRINPYHSTGRAILNLGTNISFKDGAKLYLDLERSFGGKIATEYQVNLGLSFVLGERLTKRVIRTAPKPQVKWKNSN